MSDPESGKLVTRWRAGDQQAAAELVQRYAKQLIALARRRLPANISHRVDAEDVVQSVYRSFFDAARNQDLDIQRGGDLWHLLVSITLNKLHDQLRRQTRDKRSVAREQSFGSEESLLGLQAFLRSREPSPVEAVALIEQVQSLMQRLDPLAQRIFELRLQGYDLEEIASAAERSQRTVIRVLNQIKRLLDLGYAESCGT